MKYLQWFLVKMLVIKSNGKKYDDGSYHANGLNLYNPLSWIVLIFACLFFGCRGFVLAVWELLKELVFD